MWPFTSRRIFGNRWWAVAFVIFVCYQAIDYVGSQPGSDNAADNAAAAQTDNTGDPVTEDQLRNTVDALKSL